MKKLLSMAFMLSVTTLCFTQGNNWKLDGNNNVDQNSFIGSMNNEPFILKANGNEGLRIKPNGDLRIKNFDDNTYTGLTFINSNGVLSKLNFTGNYLDVLSGNGTFISLSNFATGWSLSNNITFTTNNVGIGTNIAPEKLTVNGNILANGSISGTSINVVDIVGAGKEIKIMNSLCLKGLDVNIPGSKNMICGMNGDLYVQSTNGNYNTIINQVNTGKVGIGVIPTEDFHVGKSAKFDGGVNFSNLSINSTVTEILTIDGSGKVLRSGDLLPLASSLYNVECRTDGNGDITPFWRNGPWKSYIGGTVCEQNIKVGVNMINPVTNLHIVGDGYFSKEVGIGILPNSNSMVSVTSDQGGKTGLTVTTTTADVNGFGVDEYGIISVVDNDGTKGFALYDSRINQDVFRVRGTGQVQAKSVYVSLSIWSDFVFKDDYELMGLKDLEKYIQNNNHLPNIPSEDEVKQNAINLGEMDAKLLQKIEELTLYLINQQKEIDELKSQLNKISDKK